MTTFVCQTCLGCEELCQSLSATSQPSPCSFCEEEAAFDIEEVAAHVSSCIRRSYHSYLPSSCGDQHRNLKDLLEEAHVGAEVIDALAEELIRSDPADLKGGEHPFFGPELAFEPIPPEAEPDVLWGRLAMSLRTRRFFNQDAEELLQELFGPTCSHHGLEIKELAAGAAAIYRARRADSVARAEEFTANPTRELGAPPHGCRASRMNLHGTRVFYGAFSPGTALSEVRPLVGEYVVIGRFHPAKTLRLLNLPACGRHHAVSCFDADFARLTERLAFYAELDSRLSRPVLPDAAPLEYVVSQAVAEYLRWAVGLDGIIYGSSQRGGTFRGLNSVDRQVADANVVIFEPRERGDGDRDPFEAILRFDSHEMQRVDGVRFGTIRVTDEV